MTYSASADRWQEVADYRQIGGRLWQVIGMKWQIVGRFGPANA